MVLNSSGWELLFYIAIYYCVLGLITIVTYGLDKQAAKKNKQRTPEKTLHLLSLLGGWPVAFIGQRLFHHKTKKVSFQVIYWFTVVLNISVIVLIYLAVMGKFK